MNFKNFRDWIYFYFYEKAEPVFIFGDINIPIASVWSGMREWVRFFRRLELKQGDRICLALPFDISFLFVLFACLWEGLTTFIIKDTEYNEDVGRNLDCKLDIANSENKFCVLIQENLPISVSALRKTQLPSSKIVSLFLKTSGSINKQKWIGLSETNILTVLNSHSPLLEGKNKIQISSLPWNHAFGLVLDLLLGISTSSVIIRDTENGRDIEKILSLIESHTNVFWSTVPLSIERALELKKSNLLLKLEGGIIGGAPITKKISDFLNGSNLRVGYGQTEAGPGITLGDKGKFFPSYLGKPLGCKVRINSNSELEFSGENTYIAKFDSNQIYYYELGRWVQTNDVCSQVDEEYFFLGRVDNSFKLPNGKMFFPEEWERKIQEKYSGLGEICVLMYKENYYLFIESDKFLQKEFWNKELPSSITKNFQLIHFPKLPKYPKGGINRNELKAFLEERF